MPASKGVACSQRDHPPARDWAPRSSCDPGEITCPLLKSPSLAHLPALYTSSQTCSQPPNLLTTMQTALALAQAGASPTVLSLTRSAETASSAIDRLPAAITASLEESTGTLKELLPEIHATATETRGTAESVERIMKSLGDTPSDDPWTPAKTLSTLTEVRQVASEWNSTIKQLENTLSLVASNEAPALRVLSEAENQTCQTIDYAYRKALVAIAVLLVGQAAVVILAAWLFKRKRAL